MDAKLYGSDGAEKGTTALPEALFGQQVHERRLWLAVKRHLGNQRQGTAAVKNRALVSGGGKKPFRQKGTGRARQGSNTSPLMPGGGQAFGPRPRSYRTEMPRRQRRAALASAFSAKAADQAVSVIELPTLDAPKAATIARLLKSIGLGDKRTLLILGSADENVVKSCRNLRNLHTTLAHQVNPYELLDCEAVVLTPEGLSRVQEVFVR